MANVSKNVKLLLLLGIFSIAMVNSSLPPDFWRIMYRNFGYPGGYGPANRPLPPTNPHFRFPFIGFHPVHTPPNVPPPLPDMTPVQPQEPLLPPSPGVDPNPPIQSFNGRYKIVCYYESSAANRPEQGRFVVGDINPFMCSHVIYSFAILDDITYTIASANKKLDITQGGYKNATSLKRKNPELKVMISIGGPMEGGLKFSLMTRSGHLRTQFVESTLKFLQEHGFDGLDIYWEYPGSLKRDGRCEDKENFVKLIKELRLAFLPHGYLLSAAVAPLKEVIDDGYDLPELSRSLDFFNVIAYDYRGSNATKVDHHSPLSRRPHDEWENVFLNIEFGIRYLMEKGVDSSRLVLGIPFYGRSFTLQDKGKHQLGSSAKGPGLPGPFTNKEGYIAYYEICPGLLDGAWKIERDEYGKVPFAYSSDQWVGYDDENSIEDKMNFIKDKRLGGAMIWAIDLDDFRGRCGEKWPLTRKIYSLLCGTQSDDGILPTLHVSNDNLPEGTAYRPQIPLNHRQAPLYIPIKVPFAPIHTQPAMEVRSALYAANTVCKSNGYIRDPIDCSKFFRCSNGLLHQYICPFGLQFNELTYSCDWATYAKCQLDDDITGNKQLFICTTDGIFHDPNDCHKYYMCANGEPIQLQCSPGTAFSKRNLVCDWERNVDCRGTTTTERVIDPWEITTSRRPDPWEITTSRRPDPWEITTSRRPHPWEITTSRKPEPWEITTSRQPEPWEITTSRKPEPWEITTSRRPHPWEITTSRKPEPWEITTSRKPEPWEITTSRRPEPWETTTTTIRPSSTTRPRPSTSSPETGGTLPEGMTDNFKVVCYFTNWAWYRPGDGKFLPEDVDTALCTHVIYAFTVLDGERLELKPHDPWADIDNHFFERVVALKKINPKLKILVGVGGWTDSLGSKYSRLVNNPRSRQNFIEKSLIFINKYDFDGMDLDWEYPKCWQVDCKKGPAEDKSGFAAWVRELRAAFDSNTKRLLLTAAVSPSKAVIDEAYEVADISKNLDFINVMTYDYHGSWEKKTGHVAPLHYFPGDEFENFNANFTLHYYMQLGAPREKLIMGMPFYGQSWSLADNAKHGLNAPTYGPGEAGPFSRQGGMLGYSEICTKINSGGWSVVSDPLGRIGPFGFKGNQWFSFDDIETIRRKSQFIYDNRFGGAMLWALDFDDFRNICCKEKYPLLKTINRVLRNYPSDPNPSGGTCNYKIPFAGDNKPIMTEIRRICITSRCTF